MSQYPCFISMFTPALIALDFLYIVSVHRTTPLIAWHVVQLDALPDIHMHVGSTNLSVDEIKQWSQGFGDTYHLNVSDCRHYTNQLVHKATGVEHRCLAHSLQHRPIMRDALHTSTCSV